MATFSNQQYNQRVLTNVSDVVIAASDQGGNNQRWKLSIRGEDPDYDGYVVNSGTGLFLGWDEARQNVLVGGERYIWKFVIDWDANTIGFQIPGSLDAPDTFFTLQVENDEETLSLVVQSGDLIDIQKWTRDPALEH